MMPRYIIVERDGKKYRRRVLSKAQQAARLEKLRKTVEARRKLARLNGHTEAHDAQQMPAAAKANGNGSTLQAHGGAADAEHAALRAKVEGTLVHLRRGLEWLDGHRSLKDFDRAHVELLNAHRELTAK